MTTSAHLPRGTASDSLLVQVDAENILQVRNAYLEQQNAIDAAVQDARRDFKMQRCGDDPISQDYTPYFVQKLLEIAQVHADHVKELAEATNRLKEAALEYGHTEDQVEQSFRSFQARNAVHSGGLHPMMVDR